MRQAYIGVSGWTYPPWRGDFYPKGLPQRRELEYAASRLTSIEVNGSFYGLQKPTSYESWARQTPDDFVFAVKGSRYITHMLKLAKVETALANFFASGVLALGDKLGPVLWQLPERQTFDRGLLAAFFDLLPRTTGQAASLAEHHDARVADARTTTERDRPIRHALEFRSQSFATADALDLLRAHDIACVFADTAGRWPRVDADTSDFRYVRLHGDTELYASGYTDKALDEWAERIHGWKGDVYCYFDNDIKGFAPHDAEALIARLRS